MEKVINLPHIKGEIELGDDILYSEDVREFFHRTDIEDAIEDGDFDYVYRQGYDYLPTAVITEILLASDIDVLEYLTEIPQGAFYECDLLKSINIPNNIKKIGADAFRDCTSLTSITIPNSVKEIGGEAFYYCDSLASITIPESVTEMGYLVLGGTENPKTIYCKAKSQPIGWHTDWFGNCDAKVIWGA